MNKWLLRVAAVLSIVLLIGIIQDLLTADENTDKLHASESMQVTSPINTNDKEEEQNSSFPTSSSPDQSSLDEEATGSAQSSSQKEGSVSASVNSNSLAAGSQTASASSEDALPAASEGDDVKSSEEQEKGNAASPTDDIADSSEKPDSSREESQPAKDEEPKAEEDPSSEEQPATTPEVQEPITPQPNSIGLEGEYYAFVDMSAEKDSNLLQEAISNGNVVASTHAFSAVDSNTTYFSGTNPGVFSHFATNLQMGEAVEVVDAEGNVHTYHMTEQIMTDVFGQAVIPSLGRKVADVYISGSGEESIMLQYENGDQLVVWYGVLATQSQAE